MSTLREDQYTFLIISRSVLRKSCRLWDNVEKYSWPGEVADYNTAHAHFTQRTLGYKHRFGIYNTHCLILCGWLSLCWWTGWLPLKENVVWRF